MVLYQYSKIITDRLLHQIPLLEIHRVPAGNRPFVYTYPRICMAPPEVERIY